MRLPRRGLALVALTALVQCSDSTAAPADRQMITAVEAYTARTGETWTFLNGYGDTTTVVTEAAPDPVACRTGANTIWHYRKSAARAYWNPGIPGADLLFVLHQNADGSWRSTASVITFAEAIGGTGQHTLNCLIPDGSLVASPERARNGEPSITSRTSTRPSTPASRQSRSSGRIAMRPAQTSDAGTRNGGSRQILVW